MAAWPFFLFFGLMFLASFWIFPEKIESEFTRSLATLEDLSRQDPANFLLLHSYLEEGRVALVEVGRQCLGYIFAILVLFFTLRAPRIRRNKAPNPAVSN